MLVHPHSVSRFYWTVKNVCPFVYRVPASALGDTCCSLLMILSSTKREDLSSMRCMHTMKHKKRTTGVPPTWLCVKYCCQQTLFLGVGVPVDYEIYSDGRHDSIKLPPTAVPLCVASPRCPPDELPCSTSRTLESLLAYIPALEDTDSENRQDYYFSATWTSICLPNQFR